MYLDNVTTICPRCGFTIPIYPDQKFVTCKNCEKKIKINEFEGENEMNNNENTYVSYETVGNLITGVMPNKSTIETNLLGTNTQNAVHVISKEQVEREEFENWKSIQTPQEGGVLFFKDKQYVFKNNEYLRLDQIQGNNLFFAKVRDTAKIPTKDDENMGYDIYADFEEEYILIQPHETKMIPTGICSACSEDYAIVLKERGSTGTKGIAQRCGVIDSGYRGEWFVPVTNTNNNPIVIIKKENEDLIEDLSLDHIIYPYEKAICQAIVLPVPKMNVQEIPLDVLKSIPSKRGEGKVGSSGK